MEKIQCPIINIESSSDGTGKIYHLDWFETGIWCGLADSQTLLSKIKKSLFWVDLKESFGNQRYHNSLRSDDFGVTIFYDIRGKSKNPPLSLLLTGKFFRYSLSTDFINKFLSWFPSIQHVKLEKQQYVNLFYKTSPFHGLKKRLPVGFYNPRLELVRIDASVDVVGLEEVKKPLPHFRPEFQWPEGAGQGFQWLGDDVHGVKQYVYGKDGCRLSVYNKLLDDKDPEYRVRHPELDGCLSVWRIEFQMRKNELKSLFIKQRRMFNTYEGAFDAVFGQCARRFTFDFFRYKPSQVSLYLPRRKASEEASLSHATNLCLSQFRKVKKLEKLVYCTQEKKRYVARTEEEHQVNKKFESLVVYADFEKLSKGVPF